MPIPVALVEDNATLRRRLIERLGFFPDVELVLTAASGEAFLEALSDLPDERRPAVILMDIELPALSGIDTTALLKRDYPDIEVIMLTVFEQDDKIFRSIQAGASGYLLKDVTTDRIVGAIMELLDGGAPMSAAVARKMLHYVRAEPSPAVRSTPSEAPPFELTERELDILHHAVQGETVQVMANHLFLSPHTVSSHLKNIYRKLHVHSRAEAVRVAMENRLV